MVNKICYRYLISSGTGFSKQSNSERRMITKSNPKAVADPTAYQLKLKGYLDPQWAHWFDGLTITLDNEETVLTGPIIDQAALFGFLKKIRDLGLPLISLNRLDSPALAVLLPIGDEPDESGHL